MDLCTVEMSGYFVKKGKENVHRITNELCSSCLISEIFGCLMSAVMIDPLVVQGASC